MRNYLFYPNRQAAVIADVSLIVRRCAIITVALQPLFAQRVLLMQNNIETMHDLDIRELTFMLSELSG